MQAPGCRSPLLNFLEILDDSWFLEAAIAWPLLEILSLRTHELQNPRTTFRGLASLIRGLPNLYDIVLPLDMNTADISLLDGVPTGHIRRLQIFHPRITQRGARVQGSLRNVFLKLPSFVTCDKWISLMRCD